MTITAPLDATTITDSTTTESLDRLENLAIALGITVDHLDELVYVACADAAIEPRGISVSDQDADKQLRDADVAALHIHRRGMRAQLAVLVKEHHEPAMTALLHEFAALGVPA